MTLEEARSETLKVLGSEVPPYEPAGTGASAAEKPKADRPAYRVSQLLERVLTSAVDAARTGHVDVAREHLLLALLRLKDGVALGVLGGLKVDPGELERRVEQSIKGAGPERGERESISFTKEAKAALDSADIEARNLHSTYVGTQHLLLGLLRQEDTAVSQILNAMGIHLENARAETLGEGANVVDLFETIMHKRLLKEMKGLAETPVEFLRKHGVVEPYPDWLLRPDGSYKTWQDLDSAKDGPALWEIVPLAVRVSVTESAAMLLLNSPYRGFWSAWIQA